MRVLVVSWAYAPALYPRAFRWTAVAEHWAGRGHQVDVVAHGVPGAPAQETRGGVRVHRVGGDLANRVRRGLGGGSPAAPDPSAAAEGSAGANGGGARAAARWVHDHTWKQLYWPDFACLWYRPAVR
ncbi:MAG TPA: hypothetical protein VFT45_13245, partial [Longimicrobium sp.]|nr:hypothetical protein [Longimicrobium sp.]